MLELRWSRMSSAAGACMAWALNVVHAASPSGTPASVSPEPVLPPLPVRPDPPIPVPAPLPVVPAPLPPCPR